MVINCYYHLAINIKENLSSHTAEMAKAKSNKSKKKGKSSKSN
jgi:hypothetical protein